MHDYKTGSPLPKQEELDEDRQLAMYSLWVRRRFKDFKKVRLVWHFLAVDKEMDSFRTKKELEDLREKVLEQIKVSVVFGSDNKITVKESECIKLPAKNSDKRKELNEVLRGIGKLMMSRSLMFMHWREF